ncbi:hypothetical protein GQX73_g6904 [Xylaria multiplex]|uniref:DUF8004 domain-containing protein n=1 Tax=Xylaria multiplex TaxID=323545 RepID=A0A7C8MR41_9PEZI|nr:hypothetical protein GQX73_g6904 [Xylaria multiplex]
MDSPEVQQASCYNGVSNRSRGWKTWKLEKTPQSRLTSPTVMRWDGASRSSEVWDNLRRDPELWFREGDCYVHLHAEGQSRRGASFKVPYSALVEGNYQPLINSFISRSRTNATIYLLNPAKQPVELFIPAPPKSDKRRSYNYHLATRNLFAFIFRRSMVGDCLGSALITLYNSLRQFRTPDADNLQDLMSYMDEEGYLDLNNQPTHALAMLHLAETFQFRRLYIDAFAHCCGMSERVFLVPGFQLLSSATRTSLRRARREMYCRLRNASTMLTTFLRDELYEDDIELDTGATEHLEHFRYFLREFYTIKLNRYPPPSIDAETTIFEAKVFREMRNDFEALCEFLEDRDFDIFQSSDFLTDSHSFTLRSVQSFDARYNHETLFHPLPLFPDIPQKKPSFWKLPWWNRPTRVSKARRAETLAALARSTNQDRQEVVENHLVVLYRKFENQTTCPIRSDRPEGQGPIDGRKIRWILIYAIYQTLRRATDVPLEVRDATGAPYHVCISTASLPPWKEEQLAHALVHTQQDLTSLPSIPLSPPTSEAKPDHESFTPADQPARDTKERPTSSALEHSTSRGSSTLRRSFSLLAKQVTEQPPVSFKARRRETISCGSDNKMMASKKIVAIERSSTGPSHASSSRATGSPASEASTSSCYNSNSETATSDTPDSSVTSSPVQPATEKQENELASIRARCGLHEVDCDTGRLADRYPPVPSGKRTLNVQGDTTGRALEPAPLDIRKERKRPASIQMPSPQAPTAWDYIQAVMEIQASNYESAGWDQFTHLGDFIEVGSDALNARPASTFF